MTADDMVISTSGCEIAGYIARPTRERAAAGVIVVHEAFGLNERIRDLTRRFANAGFDAPAPDLYSGSPPDPNDMSSVIEVMMSLGYHLAVARLEAAAAHLRSLPAGPPGWDVLGSARAGVTPCYSRARATSSTRR